MLKKAFFILFLLLFGFSISYGQIAEVWKTGQTASYSSGDDGYFQRGVPWPSPRFIDHGDGTVTDNLTGLMWAKNANLPNGTTNWQEALDYVKGLNVGSGLGGYRDWRLPNRKELLSMIDRSKYNPALPYPHPFENFPVSGNYWTSTSYAYSPSNAWIVDIGSGRGDDLGKTSAGYVWPVRSRIEGCSGGILSGFVRDSATNIGLGNVTVNLSNGLSTTTNTSGHYSFPVISSGIYNIRISKDGYLSNSYNIRICGNVVKDMVLIKPAELSGLRTNSGYGPDPVNTATGNYVYQKRDLEIPGRGLPFVFERNYNSQDGTDGPLGYGWNHSYNIRLTVNPDSTVTIRWGDGKTETWTPDGSGGYVPQYGVFDMLIDNGDGTFTLKKRDLTRYNFDTLGRLSNIIDKNGNTISLTYTDGNLTRITDTVGRNIDFTYDSNNRIILITDPIGRTIEFDYDLEGNPISATDMNGNETTFTYDTLHQMLTATDPRGNIFVTNVYDDQKRVVISQRDAKGGQTIYQYENINRKTIIIDALGNATIHWHDELLRLIKETDSLGNSIEYTYDSRGNRTQVKDKNGNIIQYTYDERGNVTLKTDPLGNVTTITYDENNNPLSRTDALGNTILFEYDSNGNLIKTTDPLGNIITISYDSYGQPISITDPRGNTTTNSYDSHGNLVEVTDALGNKTQYTYDGVGRRLSIRDPLGRITTYTYDNNNNLLTVTDPMGHVTTYTYDANNNRITFTDPRGHTTTYAYDVKDLLTTTTDPMGNTIVNTYDALDRKISVRDKRGNTTTYSYDAVGNLISITDPFGNTTTFTYDANGNRLTETNPLGQTVTYVYDALNRVVSVTDPLGNQIITNYDAVGRVTSTTNAKGQATSFEYDALGRLTKVTDANGGTVLYTYDANGNRLSMRDPNGNTTSYVYDDLNRLIRKVEPLGNTYQYAYDAVGNRISLTDPNGNTISYTYDANNRLVEIKYPDNSKVSFSYDQNGNRTQMVDSLGTSVYAYDYLNRMTSYTDPFGKTVGYGYDANSNRTSLTYPDGKVVSYTYDALNRLTRVTDWLMNSTFYNYDSAGRLIEVINSNNTKTIYTYDNASRLIGLSNLKSDNSIISSYSYTLDPIGNHLQVVQDEPLTPILTPKNITFTYDQENRLLSAGEITFTYDSNGNIKSKGSDTFNYDFEDRLIQSNISGIISQYGYDGVGNRLVKTEGGVTKRYVLDVNRTLTSVLAETDQNGSITSYYVYGLGLISKIMPDGRTYTYHYDSRGSTIALTDETQSITDSYAYDSFGKLSNILGTTPNPFKYVGRYGVMDEGNGLQYIRARYYIPEIGRFITKDLLTGNENNTQSLNRYVYTLNNPVILVDINGFSTQEVSRLVNKHGPSDIIHESLLLEEDDRKMKIPQWKEVPVEDEEKKESESSKIKKLIKWIRKIPIPHSPSPTAIRVLNVASGGEFEKQVERGMNAYLLYSDIDWNKMSDDEIFDKLCKNLRCGDILRKEWYRWTAET